MPPPAQSEAAFLVDIFGQHFMGDTSQIPDGFLKAVYDDWRNRTGSGFFTVLFICQLFIWNYRQVLIALDAGLGSAEKIAQIEKASGISSALVAPFISAIVLCFILSGLHLALNYLIGAVELKRVTIQATYEEKARSAREDAENDEAIHRSKKHKELQDQLASTAEAGRKAVEAQQNEARAKDQSLQEQIWREGTITNLVLAQFARSAGASLARRRITTNGNPPVLGYLADVQDRSGLGANSPYPIADMDKALAELLTQGLILQTSANTYIYNMQPRPSSDLTPETDPRTSPAGPQPQ